MKKILVLTMLLLLTACRTSQELVRVEYEATHDTIYHTVTKVDSFLLHDSIFEKEYLKGDTVIQYKYVSKIKYQDRMLTDTLYINKTDTVKVEVEKVVTREPSFFDKVKTAGFFVLCGMIILGMIVLLIFKGRYMG